MEGGEAPGVKWTKQRRRRKLNIIRKIENSSELYQKTTEKHAPASQSTDTSRKTTDMEKNTQQPQTISDTSDHTPEVENGVWDIRNAKIIPVPPDGLCMYHCVHAAGDPDWMKNRHSSGTSYDKQRERADATRAQALIQKSIKFLSEKGLQEAAQRFAIEGSKGYPSTDEMQHLAEMLNGKIELVDLEDRRCPMTTYGEGGPVLFRIAHQNISQVPSSTCDHWVLIDLGPAAHKEARLRKDILEKLNGKTKPKVAVSNTRTYRPPAGRFRAVVPRSRKDKRDFQKSRQRRIAIERHNRNAADLSKHYIEWHPAHLECKECGC